MPKLIVLLLTLVNLVLSAPIEDDLIIKLSDGLVQGTTYLTPNNKTYYGFRGIPYATPPIGNLRFEAPQPPQHWNGILDASKDSKVCISITHWQNPDSESEDCLYINVYTPSIKPTEKLPVMLFIHGGGFTFGNSSKDLYGPDFLVEEDIIMVSFNYRLAPFGFISTGDSAIPGNAGLKDQLLALQWVHNNIEVFGGDPKKVTLFGQSAGGASVGLQVLRKASADLFRGAIMESGSAITMWTIDEDPMAYTLLLADALSGSVYENDTQKLKKFFQERTFEEIINATISLPTSEQVWPVIEVEGEGAFLTKSPYELLESGNFNQVPIITGICADEALEQLEDLEYAKVFAQQMDAYPSLVIPSSLHPNTSDEEAVIQKILDMYLKANETFSSNLVALTELFTDTAFSRGIIRQAEISSNFVPVYLYEFAYYGRVTTPAYIDGAEKAAHSAELPFLFNMKGVSGTTDASDVLTQNRMVRLWTNFAKFLNPTPEQSELFNNITWPIVKSSNFPYLSINGTIELRPNLKETTYPEWKNIFETYGTKPFITY